MTFFDNQYIASLVKKSESGHLSKLARPAFRLATYPKWQPLRDSINDIFKTLPPDSQSRLKRKRKDLENISETVNEIKVGVHLVKEGYDIEYEKKLSNLTPDWFVTAKDQNSFVVEVFTRTISDKHKLEIEYLTDIRTFSKNIPVGACLSIKPRVKNKEISWSDELVSLVVDELRKWLILTPIIRSTVEINDIEFELLAYSEKFNYVYYIITNEAFFVNSLPVKTSIESKVEKYRDICNESGLPLVVACLPSFSTGVEKEEFEEICDELFNDYPNLNSIWAFIEEKVEVFNNPKPLFLI